MLNGYILDSYVDTKRNVMVTWVINKGNAYRIQDMFKPSFFVYSSSKQNLFHLASQLYDDSRIQHLNITKAKTILGSEKEYVVLEVQPTQINALCTIAEMINEQGNYHRYEFFNVDTRMSTRYLQSKGVFCNARVRSDGVQLWVDDEQWAVDYDIPAFKTGTLEIKRNPGFHSVHDPVPSIWFNDGEIREDNEVDTILATVKEIQRYDPDIIFSIDGDSFLFPYLYHRAREQDISKHVNFGRDTYQEQRPTKPSKSYFSYGQIVYKPAFFTLKGRAHIDIHSSFMYGESGIRGLLDVSRCANIPLQIQSRVGPGTAISQIQVNQALKEGYLIPWKKNMPEQCKTARQLLISDRGGLILSPKTGIYDNVVELDFASLYPNIMRTFNISPETLLCNCCTDSPMKVPQLGYHICTKQTGLLPTVLTPIIKRRFLFKARIKNNNYDSQVYKDIQQAWKWVLIVCFGYTGYRNARYGRIECHESITAFARKLLLDAVDIAEQLGYTVLHSIVDSLWVKEQNNSVSPFKLSRKIGEQTGIRMDVEGRYKWIVFLNSKQYDVGALTRYYGLFDTGELKVRGIELRQRNTPEFIKEVQKSMLDVFSKANNAQEFIELIPQSITTLLEYGKALLKGSIASQKLLFKTRVSKDITEYKVNTLVKSALLQMRDLGFHVHPGQSIQYIVLDEHTREYASRVRVVESITGDEEIDGAYYLRHIAKCGESLLTPFGYSLAQLYSYLQMLSFKDISEISPISPIEIKQRML